MDVKEWSLIVFTFLMQAAIGTSLLAVVLRQLNSEPNVMGLYHRAITAMMPVGVIALLASLGHLGRPGAAFNALSHLATSWLSREVFFAGGFVVLLVLAVLMHRNPRASMVFTWLAAASGIGTLISMSALYTVTAIPAWQGANTYVAFIGTALLLGSATLSCLVAYLGRSVSSTTLPRDFGILVWVAIVAALGQLVVLPVYLASLGGGVPAAQASAALLAGRYAPLLVIRWVLVLFGGLVPLMVAWRRLETSRMPPSLVYIALLAICVGEVTGRYLFYASAVPIGIG